VYFLTDLWTSGVCRGGLLCAGITYATKESILSLIALLLLLLSISLLMAKVERLTYVQLTVTNKNMHPQAV